MLEERDIIIEHDGTCPRIDHWCGNPGTAHLVSVNLDGTTTPVILIMIQWMWTMDDFNRLLVSMIEKNNLQYEKFYAGASFIDAPATIGGKRSLGLDLAIGGTLGLALGAAVAVWRERRRRPRWR